MTERIYFKDASCLEFEATITSSGQVDDQYFVTLDKSAFYPTSGGQSHDTGYISELTVTDVIEDGSKVKHLGPKPFGSEGDKVHCVIDSDRRMMNRQMHTAQHLLSSVFDRLIDGLTVSVHLGEEYGAVEIKKSPVSDDTLKKVEDEVNKLIRDAIKIEVLFVHSSKLKEAGVNLRKPPSREGELRIIKIGDIEQSACGGTHCDNSSSVGFVKIIGTEKLRGNTLVKFLSGSQLLKDYNQRFKVTEQMARDMTCAVVDLPEKISKLDNLQKDMRRQITALQRQLLPLKIEEIAKLVVGKSGISIVSEQIEDIDPSVANNLASSVAEKISGVAMVLIESRLIIASSLKNVSAKQIVASIVEQTGMRGGGSDKIAQIGNVSPEIFDKAKTILLDSLPNG